MTREIIVNGKQFNVFDWYKCPIPAPASESGAAGGAVPRTHMRNKALLEEGVSELRPGEASFRCDQTLVFDTTFTLRGGNRKFVVIAQDGHRHVAKPY